MLKITADAYERMMAYTFLTDKEITAFLFSENREDDHVIYDLSLPKQTVTSTSAEVDNTGEWYEGLSKQQRLDLHGWMHSHNTMTVFASADDEKSIEGVLSIMPWCITIITNHYSDLYVRVDQSVPIPMAAKEIPLIIIPNPKVMVDLAKEVRKMVTERSYAKVVYPLQNTNQRKHNKQPHHQRSLVVPYDRLETVGDGDDGNGLLEGGGDDRALAMRELYELWD